MKTTISLLLASALLSTPVMAHDHKGNPSTGNLPPGLQKKIERGGELPPGWRDKVRIGDRIDRDIYRYRHVLRDADDRGIATIQLGYRILRVIEDTREIIEILN